MKPFRAFSLGVLAISAVLITPSTQACDDGTPAPPKVAKKQAAPKAPAPGAPPATAVEPAPAAGTAGRVVTRDPETGELRAATAEEVNRLRASARTSQATPSVTTVLPDGTVRLEPGERGLAYATLERRPDGSLKPGCVAGRDPSTPAPEPARPANDEK